MPYNIVFTFFNLVVTDLNTFLVRGIILLFLFFYVLFAEFHLNTTRKNKGKLNQSESKFKTLFEEAQTPIFIASQNQRYIDANSAALKFVEMNKKELCKKKVWDFTPPELLKEQKRKHTPFYSRRTVETEYLVNGKIKILLLNVVPFRHNGKRLLLGIGQDITERKREQQQLKESEDKFRTIAEQSFLGISISQDNEILYINDQALQLLGFQDYNKENLSIEVIDKFLHPEDKKSIEKYVEYNSGVPLDMGPIQTRFIKKDSDEIVWLEVYLKEISYQGRPAILKTFQDITEKKQIEIKLRKLSELKTQFMRRASHELKTPLVSIKGYANLLLELHQKDLKEDMVSMIDEIKVGCIRLENLIGNIIRSSKLESGEFRIETSKEDLSFLIHYTVDRLHHLANKRNQTIEVDIQEELLVKIDKESIYEVINNILVNGIKYTPPDGEIQIKSEEKNDFYVITFKDTGIGITAEEKEQIFKQFGKVEHYGQGLDLDIEGTGLGLYISKKIVELHGGNLWVESEGRNKGSTFYFSLPKVEKA